MNRRQKPASTARMLPVVMLVIFGAPGATVSASPMTSGQDDPVTDSSAPGLVQNGNFADWKDNLPIGWKIEIGATDGARQPESRIARGDGPSLELSGDASTRAWRITSQSNDVTRHASPMIPASPVLDGDRASVKQKGNKFTSSWAVRHRANNETAHASRLTKSTSPRHTPKILNQGNSVGQTFSPAPETRIENVARKVFLLDKIR